MLLLTKPCPKNGFGLCMMRIDCFRMAKQNTMNSRISAYNMLTVEGIRKTIHVGDHSSCFFHQQNAWPTSPCLKRGGHNFPPQSLSMYGERFGSYGRNGLGMSIGSFMGPS